MNMIFKKISLLVLLIGLCPTISFAQTQQIVGNVSRLEGDVAVVRADQKSMISLGDDILRSDELVTRKDALVEVQFSDGSSFLLDENTTVTIAEYAPGDAPRSLLELTRGRLRSKVSNAFSSRNDSYQVRTREGVMGVQGTEFEVVAGRRETSVYVYEGVVSATSQDLNHPGTTLLGAGDFISIRLGDPIRPPNRFFGFLNTSPVSRANEIIGSGGEQAIISGGNQTTDPTALAPTMSEQPASEDIVPPPPRPPSRQQ